MHVGVIKIKIQCPIIWFQYNMGEYSEEDKMSETTNDNQEKSKRSKTTEIEDFESLYRNIQNDVVRERIKSTGEWYIRHAKFYKILFYVFSIISIVLPLIISSVNVLGAGHENEIRVVTTITSAIVSLITALLTFTKCGEKWTLYRSTIEMMKSELALYNCKNRTDEELEKLVFKLEKIMNQEHNKWRKMQQEDESLDESIEDCIKQKIRNG